MSAPETFDTIIIGAGSAGAVLAARLSEDDARTVLLVEAGPDYPDLASTPVEIKHVQGTVNWDHPYQFHDWGYHGQIGPEFEPIHIPRGKVTGGSSAVNAMIFLRGEPDDFEHWVVMGNEQWSFNKVLPYYKKLERDLDFNNEHHGTTGPTPVRRYRRDEWLPDQAAYYDGCRSLGFPDCPDHNRPYTTGVGPFPLNYVDGLRQSTAVTYLRRARKRPNLIIMSDTTVHSIRIKGQKAIGVRVEQAGSLKSIDGSEVILSAGAIASPQLLMLSGIGPADHLREFGIPIAADLPGVGQNLRDHPTVNMRWRFRADAPLPPTYDRWRVQVGLRYTATGSNLSNDMIIYIVADSPDKSLIMRPTINLAAAAGELRLRSTDVTDRPALDYRYFSNPFDLQRQREVVRLCIKLAHTPGFEALLAEPLEPAAVDLESNLALDNWILRSADTGHHSSGTCKMGPASDPLAVVDQAGRVYGIENLRVVDASIMPDCVRANINATVLMLGERIADLIRQIDS